MPQYIRWRNSQLNILWRDARTGMALDLKRADTSEAK